MLACTAFLLGTLGGCAGDLRHPERFSQAVKNYYGGSGNVAVVDTNKTIDAGPAVDGEDASAPGDTSGDGTTSDATSPLDTTPPDCVLALFKRSCALPGCHAKGAAQIDLASAGVGDRLVDQQSSSKACADLTYVTTDGSPSLLVEKVMDPPPCGAKMPVGSKLSDADTQCLTDWVSSLSARADSGDTQ